jgi:regulator of sigma E protease
MTAIIFHNLLSFIFIISLIVFIHEFGHYYIAKKCGVKIEQFSIGFGKEIFGFTDKYQTRWKFCLIPFGGYVKMFGDKDPTSIADKKVKQFTKKEQKISFFYQNVYKRVAIVLAGPLANFILAILLLTIIFKINGINTTLPIVSNIIAESPAAKSGILPNDEIIKINNKNIKSFEEITRFITINGHQELTFEIKRNNKIIKLNITPELKKKKDLFSNEVDLYFVGIESKATFQQDLGIISSFINATIKTYDLSISTLTVLKYLATGQRSLKELGGPIKIAQYSGQSIDMGLIITLYFIAIISINLGVINLLPIPTLDGGHLLFYFIELIKGKPLSEKIQEYCFRFGISFVIFLMIFTIFNDIHQFIR